MVKLEFIGNKVRYVLEPGCTYLGLHSPFSSETFQLVEIIPDCSLQCARDVGNGDHESTNGETCIECIKSGLNYRIKYQYSNGTIKTRARHRFKPGKNFRLVE